MMDDRFYIDCEFDGHNGPLLSMAIVAENGDGMYIIVADGPLDCSPWVTENVIPLMDMHHSPKSAFANTNEFGDVIRTFLGNCQNPVIIADSPVDIGRFCQAISTGPDGGWASADYPQMTFEVHNVDCYPTEVPDAVQHNAWWDAMALRHKLAPKVTP